MRLPDEFARGALALGLTVLLGACGLVRGGSADLASAPDPATAGAAAFGPAADYPVVLGDPYEVDGEQFTPVDTLNYDEVGYAALDSAGGAGVTVAHKTLPLPSYVEITALDSGKTILARVERRGPMSTRQLVALSPGASAQLGLGEGGAVRVRRVNPPEEERALLRMGKAAPDRMDTPASLLAVLMRKLPVSGSVNLASAQPNPAATAELAGTPTAAAPAPAAPAPVRVAASSPPAQSVPAQNGSARGSGNERKAVDAYPLPPLGGIGQQAAPAEASAASAATPVTLATLPRLPGMAPAGAAAPQPAPARTPPATTAQVAAKDGFVIQAGAFSSKANAERAARAIGGFVEPSGRLFRVRKGPFADRGQAEAALAKVRAAGYSDAQVFSLG